MSKSTGSGGNSETIVPVGQFGELKPKGLIDVISEIEWYHAAEARGGGIPENFFTTRNKLDFFEVGFKGSFLSGLISALLAPIAIGVIETMIPVFGSSKPATFDKVFVVILALSFSIGYAVFVGKIGKCYTGKFTKSMIRNFVSGVVTGAIMKAVIAFLFFHFLYLTALTEKRIASFVLLFRRAFSYETLSKIYVWLVDFRVVFLTASWFVVATTLIFISIPVTSIVITSIRNKKKQKQEIL